MSYQIPSALEISNKAKEGSASLKALHGFLKTKTSMEVDQLFTKHLDKITAIVDCTTCGNCCKMLEAGVSEDEIVKLSSLKHVSPEDFKRQLLLQENDSKAWYLKETPCTFLKDDCRCAIYDHRPLACSNYPGLYLAGIKYRLRSVWANYAICPIVFANVEAIKSDLVKHL